MNTRDQILDLILDRMMQTIELGFEFIYWFVYTPFIH